jgi:predicted O-methyltransferase YrrM
VQLVKLKNIAVQAMHPRRFAVMANKIVRRLSETRHPVDMKWLEASASPIEELAERLSPKLWQEAMQEAEQINRECSQKLRSLGVDLGGGGAVPYLYFFTRFLRAQTIVETGVAAGYSSLAILEAIRKNGYGRLYSSDFPYFRLEKPEQYIGLVVDDDLKKDWTLLIEGDKENIPAILNSVDHIDLFHYDSDKSCAGRGWTMSKIEPYLGSKSIIIMDDIQDNDYFQSYVSVLPRNQWAIFKYEGKFVGIVGRALEVT